MTAPIFENGNRRTKLLGKNIEVNESFLAQLSSRGISSVSISKRDLAAMLAGAPQGISREAQDHRYASTNFSSAASQQIEAEIQSSDLQSETLEIVDRQIESREDPFDPQAVEQQVVARETQIAFVDDLFVRLLNGDGAGIDELQSLCRDSIKSIVADKDMFLCLGINPYDSEYPTRHSMHVCSVATSIGVALGLDDQSLVDMGTGCLIHDVGMLKLDQGLYRTKKTLKEREWAKSLSIRY